MPEIEIPRRTEVHWGRYFSVLSLSSGRPFWPDMGLNLDQATADWLFDLTADTLGELMEHKNEITELSHFSLDPVLEQYYRALTLLPNDGAEVLSWTSRTFLGGAEERYEWAWRSTLTALAWEISDGGTSPGLSSDKQDLLNQYVSNYIADQREMSFALDKAERAAIEGPDRTIFTYYGIQSSDDLIDQASPLDDVACTYDVVHFRGLWRMLLANEEVEVMHGLYEAFKDRAKKIRLVRSRPELVRPPKPEEW